jgi:hypothetical protein
MPIGNPNTYRKYLSPGDLYGSLWGRREVDVRVVPNL